MSGLVVKLGNGEQVTYAIFIHLTARLEGMQESNRCMLDYLIKKSADANHPLENPKMRTLLKSYQYISNNGNLREDVAKIVANLKEENGRFKVSVHSISSPSTYEVINQCHKSEKEIFNHRGGEDADKE